MSSVTAQSSCSVCEVIPMHNAANSIQKTLESLNHQTCLPDNVIVVDDGSSDLGPQIVEHYTAPFPLTLLQQANEGPASARNNGILRAEETLIAFHDADDPVGTL